VVHKEADRNAIIPDAHRIRITDSGIFIFTHRARHSNAAGSTIGVASARLDA
jgi:hypothetical protein